MAEYTPGPWKAEYTPGPWAGFIYPAGVKVVETRDDGYAARWRHLLFICGREEHGGQGWTHVSISRDDNAMPTYDDLKAIKGKVLGGHRVAYQVFPTAADHVDIAGPLGVEVLHLWSPDIPVLPDFTKGLGML